MDNRILNHKFHRWLVNTEKKSLASFVVPYEIASLTDTQFMDVFPYFSDEEEQIPENLKPLTEEKTEEEI